MARSVRRWTATMKRPGRRIAGLRSPMSGKVILLSLVCAVALSGCATTRPEEDPVQIKLNDLDRRLDRLERVLSNQSLLELSQQIQGLQGELRSLRGDVEELQHSMGNGKNQQRDLYSDLDRRIQALE